MTDRCRLAAAHVIVTGGGRGIGEATARRFAAEGADVLVISRTESEVAAVAESIRADGGSAWHAVGDVASAADVDRIVTAGRGALGGQIDVLVNNAGIDHDCAVLDFPEAEWRRVLDVNLTAPVPVGAARRTCDGRTRGSARSCTSRRSTRSGTDGTQVAYITSKAGLLGLNRSLVDRARAARHPLDGRESRLRRDAAHAPVRRRGDVRVHDDTVRAVPAGPDGRRPTRSPGAILFLASDDGRHVNGVELTVDGGTTANLYIVETLPSAGAA